MSTPIPEATDEADALPPSLDARDHFSTEHLANDMRGRVVRGATATVTADIARQLLWFSATIVLARLLTPADTGLVAMVLVVTGFLELFNELGLSAATIQRATIDQAQVSALFWINVIVSIVLGLTLVAIAPAIGWFYGEPRLVWMAIALSSAFVWSGLGVQHRALLRRQMRFRALATISIVLVAIETITGIAAALAGFGPWSLVLMRLVSGPIDVIAVWLICRWRPSWPAKAHGVRTMLIFGGNLTGFRLLNYVARNLDNLLIGRVYGPGPLGIYSKAYSLLLLPLHAINNPVSTVAIPALSRLVDTPDLYRQEYTAMTRRICVLTMPFVAFLIGSAEAVVLVLLGPQWIGVAPIFSLLGLSGLIEPFSFTISWLLITQGYTRRQLHWGFISTALIGTAIVVGLPWGPQGVAASYGLVSLVVRFPLLFWFAGREGILRTADLYRIVAPFACVVATTLAALAVVRLWVIPPDPLIGLLINAVITVVATIGTLAALPAGRLVLQDLTTIPGLFFSRTRIR